MPRTRNQKSPARSMPASRFNQPASHPAQHATVPVKWLLSMLGLVGAAAVVCAWGTLCFMFWQGSWQLLYRPSSAIVRTPARKGLHFDEVAFGAAANGQPNLRGWWIPAAQTHGAVTALYLHGATGNMGDTVDMLNSLHMAGLNVLAFDYRGYGKSAFAHPSEQRWREDAEAALAYLTGTRHIAAVSIVLVGRDLGANLAAEVAAQHGELGGLVMIAPIPSPTNAIFRDPRARLVPARALVNERWELRPAATQLKIPVLWFEWTVDPGSEPLPEVPDTYSAITAPRNFVWLMPTRNPDTTFSVALSSWLPGLTHRENQLPPCLAGLDIPC